MKITESYLRNIIKEELDNILKQNLSPIYESYESLKVNVNDDEEIKTFAQNNKGFKEWVSGLGLKRTPNMPGDYRGKGGLVDRYVAIEQAKRRKGNN
jgi:hypothetical protein